MTLDEILQEMHSLEEDLASYERKYGVLSETFYESYTNGEEPAHEAWVLDWTRWASAYRLWLQRHEQYVEAVRSLRAKMRSLSELIEKGGRYEPLQLIA